MTTSTKEWVGASTVAKAIGVREETIRSWTADGLLEHIRTRRLPNGRLQYNVAELNEYVAKLNGEERK